MLAKESNDNQIRGDRDPKVTGLVPLRCRIFHGTIQRKVRPQPGLQGCSLLFSIPSHPALAKSNFLGGRFSFKFLLLEVRAAIILVDATLQGDGYADRRHYRYPRSLQYIPL